MALIEKIKERLGIAAAVTVYDDELSDLIEYAKSDLLLSGVSAEMISAEPPEIVNTISFFVKYAFADDSKESERFGEMYQKSVFRLSTQSWEDNTDENVN